MQQCIYLMIRNMLVLRNQVFNAVKGKTKIEHLWNKCKILTSKVSIEPVAAYSLILKIKSLSRHRKWFEYRQPRTDYQQKFKSNNELSSIISTQSKLAVFNHFVYNSFSKKSSMFVLDQKKIKAFKYFCFIIMFKLLCDL